MAKPAQHSAAELDRLVAEKRYPQLERELAASDVKGVERSYFEGILADRCNRLSESISTLEKILPVLRTANKHRAAIALRALGGDYFKVGRYADASLIYAELHKEFASEFSSAERKAIRDNHETFELLRGAPPQTVSGMRTFTVPLQRDPLADVDVPIQIGDVKQWWIFDTGANISTIKLSTAKQLGLNISQGRASTQGSTGAEVPLWTTVIPEIHFGEAVVRNVVALVTEDKEMDIPMGKDSHYQITGILGYPVMAALGSFTATGDQMAVAPERPETERSTHLYVEELSVLVEASVNGQDLLFGLDTGSDSAEFEAPYVRQFPSEFASLKTKKKGFGGAGGARMLPVYFLPRGEMHLGGATAIFKDIPVVSEDRGLDPLDNLFGNLGQGLLRQFSSYTIDFTNMRLTVGENAK